MSFYNFGSHFLDDNVVSMSANFPKKRLSFKARRKSTKLVKQINGLSEMSPSKASSSQSPSKQQRKLTDWICSSSSQSSPTASPTKAKSSLVSTEQPSILSQFLESGESITLSYQIQNSPQKFMKKAELSPSPKKKTPAKRKLTDDFLKSPCKSIAIDSYFKNSATSLRTDAGASISTSIVTSESCVDGCIVISDDSSSDVTSKYRSHSEDTGNEDIVKKETNEISPVIEDNLHDIVWDDDPFENGCPEEVVKSELKKSSLNSEVKSDPTVKETNSPKKKSPRKYSRNFEYLVSFLIKNPMSDQATKDGILSHNDVLKLINKLEELPCDAQMLYKRLFGRTKTWYRLKNDFTKYEHLVEDMSGLLAVLEKSGLICSDCSSEEVEVLLNLLLAPELKEICKTYKINLNTPNKSDMINALLKYGNRQKSLSNVSTMARIKARVMDVLGTSFRLIEEPRRLFHLLLVLSTFPYFRGEEKDRLSSLELSLSGIRTNTVRFPTYAVRPMKVFTCYSHLEQFAESIQISAELFSLIDRKEKEDAAKVVITIKEKFIEYLNDKENMDMISGLKNYLVKFTAGQTYAYCLNKGITILKSTERYTEAEQVLHLLLGQTTFIAGARGQWYNELALIHETQFKDVLKAMEFVSHGLEDVKVSLIDRTTLTQRGLKLLKRKNVKNADEVKKSLQSLIDNQINYEPPNSVITAVAMAGGPGKKQVFVKDTGDGKQVSSVEEYVVEYYKYEAETTYQYGRHDEGSFLMNLVVALFFDIIYCQPVEDESFFLCPMQSKPLDWGSRGFYMRRKELIEDHLDTLRSGGLPVIRDVLEELCNNVYNTESLVNWQNLSIEKLDKICEILDCVGVSTFLNIAEHVIKDHKSYRSGFPDLILWDPASKKSLFVEVKGPNDSLSITQTVWLKNLNDFGANAIVVHVETPGTTKRRPK